MTTFFVVLGVFFYLFLGVKTAQVATLALMDWDLGSWSFHRIALIVACVPLWPVAWAAGLALWIVARMMEF